MTRKKRKPNRFRRRNPLQRIWAAVRVGLFASVALTGGLVMSAGLIFAYDVLTQTTVFSAKRIDITGNHRLAKETIMKAAQLTPGVNIFSVNLPRTRNRLLDHPWIAEADISRILPDSLRIRITEHSPVARIQLDRDYILNTAGEIFKSWSKSDPVQLPRIDGLSLSDIYIPGEDMTPTFKAIMDVIRMGMEKHSLLPILQLSRIHVDREMGITIYLVGHDTEIRLGYGAYPEKYRLLTKVRSYLKKQRKFESIRRIDLRNTNRVIVTPIRTVAIDTNQKEA